MTTEITEVYRAQQYEAVGKVSSLTIEVPRSELPTDLMDVHEIGFERDDIGETFRGYVALFDAKTAEDGSEITVIVAEGREVELRWADTYRGIMIDDEDLDDALAILLDGTGWTATVVGTYSNTITRRFNAISILDAVLEVATMAQAFVTFDNINRVVTVSNAPESSSIVIRDTPTLATPVDYGILREVKSAQEDRTGIYNRVIPFAKSDGDAYFDLRWSNRSSPYSRQSMLKIEPSLVDFGAVNIETSLEVGVNPLNLKVNFRWPTEIICSGDNRFVAVVFMALSDISGVEPEIDAVSIGGRPGMLFQADDLPIVSATEEGAIFGFYAVNPQKGPITIEGTVNRTENLLCFVFSAQDVDPRNPIRQDVQSTPATTGTSDTVTLSSSVAGDLLLSILAQIRPSSSAPNAPTPTNGATLADTLDGPSTLLETAGSTVRPRISGSYKIDTGNDVMSWTWTTNNANTTLALALRPALVFYLQNSVSVGRYDLRVLNLPVSFNRTEDVNDTAIANAMYDYAAGVLDEVSVPKISYDLDVPWLPLGPLDWSVGNTIEVDAAGIDATLVVPERRAYYNADGTLTWDLVVATQNKFRATFFDMLRDIETKQLSVRANQT